MLSPVTASNLANSIFWGWTLNTMVRVDSEPGGVKRFPKLALALSMSLPKIGVSEEAANLMKFALKTGLQPGIIDADKQYFANATVERLHELTSKRGFTPSTEYRVDRLGVQCGKSEAESSSKVVCTAPAHPPTEDCDERR